MAASWSDRNRLGARAGCVMAGGAAAGRGDDDGEGADGSRKWRAPFLIVTFFFLVEVLVAAAGVAGVEAGLVRLAGELNLAMELVTRVRLLAA